MYFRGQRLWAHVSRNSFWTGTAMQSWKDHARLFRLALKITRLRAPSNGFLCSALVRGLHIVARSANARRAFLPVNGVR